MLILLYIMSAIILILVGHIIKSLRWKQLISIYEDVDTTQLLLAMSIGQVINMIIPLRLGDMFRIWRVGQKNLNNGYVLSLATVIVDIFIDTITVGLAFFMLYVLGIHKSIVRDMALYYGILTVTVIIVCVLAAVFKKYVKRLIQNISSVFSTTIERRMLMTSYTLLTSMKDVSSKKNLCKIFVYTIGVWGCYFLSYDLFATFLQQMGYECTLTDVFKIIFSMSGGGMLLSWISMGANTYWLLWFGLYLIVPLVLIIIVVSFYRRVCESKNNVRKSNRIIPQINENERLAFLNIYFQGNNRDYFDLYLTINKDVSVLRDCSAGSNATTILAMNEKVTFYRKYAFGTDAKKLNEQIEWLELYKDRLPLCNILKKEYKNDSCYYDMEYLSNAVGYFQYIHTVKLEQSWKILRNVIESLDENLYSRTTRSSEMTMVKEYVDKKVVDNIMVCKKWCKKYYTNLFDSDIIYINGSEYKNLSYYDKYLNSTYLMSVFSEDVCTSIHGDLTIENIVCVQGMEEEWYLIDPNTGSMHETPYLDYAKLLQSLHGKYEFLMMVKDVQITGNCIEFVFTSSMSYQALYEKYKEYLFDNFSNKKVKSIFYHEAIHWLRLMPYKIRKNPQSAIIFYAGMLMILKDIEEMFEIEKYKNEKV